MMRAQRPNTMPQIFYEDKIAIEPDLDPRKSTLKALPAPPTTPKRVMRKYRFSVVFPLVFVLAGFVLSLVLVLASQDKEIFSGQYLIAFNTSRIGQDVIRFEKVDSKATRANNPLNPFPTDSLLNPSNPDGPLNRLDGVLNGISSNLTDAVNGGLGQLINGVVEETVREVGIRDEYFVYLQKLCIMDECRPWSETRENLTSVTNKIPSSVMVGDTKISVPLIAKLSSSLGNIVGGARGLLKAILAFLIISQVGFLASAISMVPAILFPQSRLLIYANMAWTSLAAVFSLLAAILLTALIAGTAKLVEGFGETVGVSVAQGGTAIVFAWMSWLVAILASVYWASVWFLELRTWRVKVKQSVGRRHSSYGL